MKFKNMPKLSERLKYIRTYKNLSQVDVAELVGTTQQAIQQAEAGKARQPRYLHKLAMELDIPIEWMMFGTAVTDKSAKKTKKTGMADKSSEILDDFFSMSERDQELMAELIKSRRQD